jgi:hypothetical protein
MAEFNLNTNRLVYQSSGLQSGITVTMYIYSPTLIKSSLLNFTELESGVYYCDISDICKKRTTHDKK